ncbi:MAG TPA: hypothetical protein VLA93_19855 [Pyrinomonadaceae bacterium]|nr:hypothetical protein [Pyrinomonadaceae bacterium]
MFDKLQFVVNVRLIQMLSETRRMLPEKKLKQLPVDDKLKSLSKH